MSLHIIFLFACAVGTNIMQTLSCSQASLVNSDFIFAGGKSITTRQCAIEMIKLVGRLREDGIHEGVGGIERNCLHQKMKWESWLGKAGDV